MGSAALGIGPVQQRVWLEQRLDIVVPVQLDMPTPADALCARADVYFGDNLVEQARVQVVPENTETPAGAQLHITTAVAVNEPVVTVELQIGCAPTVVRRFMLLPDIPERSAAPVLSESPTPAVAALPIAPAAITGAALPDATGAQRAATGAVQRPSTPAATARARAKPRLRTPPPRTQPAARESDHLTLEPLQAVGAQTPLQDTPPEATPPSTATSGPSDSERLLALQVHVLQLLQQSVDNDTKLAALRARVEQAESERATLATVLGVLGIMAAITAVALPLWLRRRRQTLEDDPDLDPEVQELIVDFNPVDADRWGPAPQTAR